MEKKLNFVALGGGHEVGASCYFLNIDNKNFLFDCGKGIKDNMVIGPDFSTVLFPPFLTSLSQIDSVFISHGHFDHIGYLPDFIEQCSDAPIIATDITKRLVKYLMWDRCEKSVQELSSQSKITYDIRCLNTLSRIHTVPYFQRLSFKDYQVTFFEAGHIPGAAMIYLETDEGSVLYTGDFTVNPTPLAKGCILPTGIKPDTIILCGLHARCSNYSPLEKIILDLNPVIHKLNTRKPVYITIKQLTKGLELLQIINKLIEIGKFPDVNIFIDDNMWKLSQLIDLVISNKNCHCFPKHLSYPDFGLYIGSGYGYFNFKNVYDIDFSLHAVYDEIKLFIKKYDPKNVIIVHMANDGDSLKKYALKRDFDDTNFIYAQNGQIYII